MLIVYIINFKLQVEFEITNFGQLQIRFIKSD